MSQLFDRLPNTLFSPLASPNRRIYANLIIDLYPLFFDHIHSDIFPSRESVRFEIDERLAVMSLVWQDDEEDYEVGETTPAGAVYRRLHHAGWFEEEHEGYRVLITVPPSVSVLWSGLMEIARPEKVFYGGMVLSIHNNVQQALAQPEEQALALRQAAVEAQRFHQHLNAMIYGLKGMLERFTELDDHRKLLSGFFDEFVEHFLVQDYKRLTTRNNPFRFRQKILDGVRDLEFDVDCKQALVKGYMEQSGEPDSEAAWQAINNDIDRLRQTFEQIDGHLNRINLYRGRVERRVADTVRYLDRTQPGMSAKIAQLCQNLSESVATLPDDDSELNWLPLIEPAPLGTSSLYEPRKLRRPPEPRPLQTCSADPELRERQKRMRAYLDRRRIDPKRIVAYLEDQLGERTSISGDCMSIHSVEDFIAFSHCRHLTYLAGAGKWSNSYQVKPTDEPIDNDWLRCPGFVIHRIQVANKSSNHAA